MNRGKAMINDISKILLSCDDIERLTNRIAKDISQKNQDGNLLMICILKGSFMFFADIVRKLSVPCEGIKLWLFDSFEW